MRWGLGALSLLLFSCSGDRRVPFGEEPSSPREETPTTEFVPESGRSFPSGTASVALEGANVELEGLRALLTQDFDDDGDRDAVVVAHTETEVRVAHARREAAAFEIGSGSALPLGEGCTVEQASVTHPVAARMVASASIRCEEEESNWTAWWVLSREAVPRVLESVSVRTPDAPVSFSFEDVDDDGHDDVTATVQLGEHALPLRFLDRPSGLARTRGEAETFLSTLNESEKPALARRLCAGARAEVRVGNGDWGLSCPDEMIEAAQNATLVAQIRNGDLVGALLALEGVPSDEVREALVAASALNIEQELWVDSLRTPTAETTHLGLRFDGDDVIVRGAVAERYRPGSSTPTPADAVAAPIVDPGETLVAVALTQSCTNLAVRLLPTRALRSGGAGGRRVEVLPREAPANCSGETPPEFRILGWAPQGLLLGRLVEPSRVVIPLSADGLPAGPPVELQQGEAGPTPLRGGRITADGSTWILETRYGILRTTSEGTALWRPPNWNDIPVDAAALSADGRRVVMVQGRKLLRLQQGQ
ncbi:MAG: hypothetical protein AAGE52_04040 [Myxococcota bacterium]